MCLQKFCILLLFCKCQGFSVKFPVIILKFSVLVTIPVQFYRSQWIWNMMYIILLYSNTTVVNRSKLHVTEKFYLSQWYIFLLTFKFYSVYHRNFGILCVQQMNDYHAHKHHNKINLALDHATLTPWHTLAITYKKHLHNDDSSGEKHV